MAILEKKLDRPSGTLGCPIDELGCVLGSRYVLAGGCAVVWALRGLKGAKKNLSVWPQNRGCGRLKSFTPIRLEGVKRYPSSVSHFFTGRVRVLHGGCHSAPQRARFGSWALWWSAIADMRAGAGQAQPAPSSNANSRILGYRKGSSKIDKPCLRMVDKLCLHVSAAACNFRS